MGQEPGLLVLPQLRGMVMVPCWLSWAAHASSRCCRDEARKESDATHLPEPQGATKPSHQHPCPHRNSSFFYFNGA